MTETKLTLEDVASLGDITLMELLKQREEKEGKTFSRRTLCEAMKSAAKGGHIATMEWLSSTERWKEPADNWYHCIRSAAVGGHISAMEWIVTKKRLDAGKGYDRLYFEEALKGAAEGGHIEAVEWCFKHGAVDKQVALICALSTNQLAVVQYLKERES